MPRRALSISGYYHVCMRSAGQIALFEDDGDRRRFLTLLKSVRDKISARVIAWVLMTDHVHLVLDFGESPEGVSGFMRELLRGYSRYYNTKTGRAGTLFEGRFWSKPIIDDAQLVSTVHYIHMNPETAGMARMRAYHWSSYQEYAGRHWVVDTATVLGLFGSFERFDRYEGSPKDVVRDLRRKGMQDGAVLSRALAVTGTATSDELRSLPIDGRNHAIRQLKADGASVRQIARVFGIGVGTVSRALK